MLESALEEEMSEHVGYDKHAPISRNRANSRNGTRTKTVMTDNAVKVEERPTPGRNSKSPSPHQTRCGSDAPCR